MVLFDHERWSSVFMEILLLDVLIYIISSALYWNVAHFYWIIITWLTYDKCTMYKVNRVAYWLLIQIIYNLIDKIFRYLYTYIWVIIINVILTILISSYKPQAYWYMFKSQSQKCWKLENEVTHVNFYQGDRVVQKGKHLFFC